MSFAGEQKEFSFLQLNTAAIDRVFPLLCPVREYDWLDGWTCKMIYSTSGLIEKGCVFSTAQHGREETIWYVSIYDTDNYEIEFIRLTPGENLVKIHIKLSPVDNDNTNTLISYQYTGLNKEQNEFINTGLEEQFKNSMHWWQKAINHYLVTGRMLKK